MIPEKAKIKAATNAEVTTDKTKERGRWTTGSAVTEAWEKGITFEMIFQYSLFFAGRFFCSSLHLLICCSYSVEATSDMISSQDQDLKYLIISLLYFWY